MLICVVTFITALVATALSTFAAAVAAFFASLHDIVVVVRRNAAAAAAAAVAAIPAVHATHETHEAPYATVAFGRVDSYHVVGVVPARETVPESDCDLDLAFEVAVGHYGQRRLPRQATTDSTMTSHKSLTM